MNILIELLQNGLYIIEGYITWAWNIITGKTRQLALDRMEICNKCGHNKNGVCDICGCILKAKSRVNFMLDEEGKSIDGCPERKW